VKSLVLAALLIPFAAPAPAQTSYGSIVGTVTDSSAATIPGAAVMLTNLGTAERRTVSADADGNYRFVNLIPGNYRLQVEIGGFKKLNRKPIQVEVQSAVRIDATMEVGDVADTVTVSAETPLLQTQTGTIGRVVEGRVVQDMPLNGRSFQTLIMLTPGVVVTVTGFNDQGQFSVNGQHADANYFTVDGVSAYLVP